MKLYILLYILITLVSCNQKVYSPGHDKKEVKYFKDIVGHKLVCMTTNGPADVLIFSPHIIGVWSKEEGSSLEYFKSDFLSKDLELYFQSVLVGKANYTTIMRKPEDLENRRLRLKIENGKVKLLVANGLEKDRKPRQPQEFLCDITERIDNFFSPGIYTPTK